MHPERLQELVAGTPLDGLGRGLLQEIAVHARERRLEAGQTLLEAGADAARLYLVVTGRLRAFLDDGAAKHDLGALEAGAVLGEIGVLAGGRRAATVVADTAGTVLELDRRAAELVLEREPTTAARLARLATERLHRAQLARQLGLLFPDVDAVVRSRLLAEVEWVRLASGALLLRRGEPADAAYVVVSGRLRVLPDPDGTAGFADVGPGELVGELALLEGGTRAATLVAVRDTLVARLEPAALLAALGEHPEALLAIVRTALARAGGAAPAGGGERRSVALVAAHPSVDLPALARALVSELGASSSARLVVADDADDALAAPGLARSEPDEPRVARITQWMQEQEQRHDTLLLLAEASRCVWTEVALRSADHLAVVADATAGPAPTAEEERVRADLRARSATRGAALVRHSLVLIHPPGTSEPPRGTEAWLDARTVDGWYHVRDGWKPDLARLARGLAERPVGLVLSGGGARGFAHLGVMRALEDAGVPVDMVAGTSIGATMGAFLALDLPRGERLHRAKTTLDGIMDWTLPLAGLAKGLRVAQRAHRQGGARAIEDLWLPWMAVTTNLTRSEVAVHQRGSLAKALRASGAIPGVVPPVVYGDELHVDGGVLDNLPVEAMRRANPRGPVIAVDVAARAGPRALHDFGLSVSGWELLVRRLLPGRRAPAVPGIAATLVHSMIAGSSQQRERVMAEGLADLHLEVQLPPCGLLEFDAADRLVTAGYASTAARVRDWAAALPPGVRAGQR